VVWCRRAAQAGASNKARRSCWSWRSRPRVELGSCWLLPWRLRPWSKALLLLELLLWLLLELLLRLWLELLLWLEVLLGRELLLLVEGWPGSGGSLGVPRGLGRLASSAKEVVEGASDAGEYSALGGGTAQ